MAGDTVGKYSVPVLWDKKLKTIVNNESSEIIQMFDSAFDDLAKNNIDL
jgi:putative glutathione S-transferase